MVWNSQVIIGSKCVSKFVVLTGNNLPLIRLRESLTLFLELFLVPEELRWAFPIVLYKNVSWG